MSVVMKMVGTNVVKGAKTKMSILQVMNAVHKTKMFGKNKSEPMWKVFRFVCFGSYSWL